VLWCLTPLLTIFYRGGHFFLVEETGSTRRKPPTCRKSLTNFNTYCYIEYTSPWTWFELPTLVVTGTDCNYHTITNTTAPIQIEIKDTTDRTRSASYFDLHMQVDCEDQLRPTF